MSGKRASKRHWAFRALLAAWILACAAGGWLMLGRFARHRRLAEWPRRWAYTFHYWTHADLRGLLDELSEMYELGTFPTRWDVDTAVHLSKRLYTEVEMFGERKFRYRPNARKLSFMLEIVPGDRQQWDIPAAPRARELLSRIRPAHLAEARYDADGFRDSALPPRPELPTVLFLGDSFTDGHAVADGETFVARFGRLAQARGYATALNAGVNGYGAPEELHTLRRARLLRPGIGLVVLSHFPNDVDADYGAVLRGAIDDEERKWREHFVWLSRLAEACAQDGLPLVLAAIPPKEQARDGKLPRNYQDRLAAFARERDLLFIDPLDEFRAAGDAELYFSWDAHFSPEGHRRYAELLWKAIPARYPALRGSPRPGSPRAARGPAPSPSGRAPAGSPGSSTASDSS